MPSNRELELFREFLANTNNPHEAADRYPIITYQGAVNAASLDLDGPRMAGQHIRALCLGLYYGMPPEASVTCMFNTNLRVDSERFSEGLPTENWNGIWIHQGHGGPQDLTGSSIKMPTFYKRWAKPIFSQDHFSYGLMKSCHAARRGMGDSAIEMLANMHQDKQITLYGANAVTWVPLAGDHLGCPLIKPSDVYYTRMSNFGDYYSYGGAPNDAFKHAEECMKENYTWSDMIPYLTDAYYELVGFSPDKALPIAQNDKGSNPDTNWYGTGME